MAKKVTKCVWDDVNRLTLAPGHDDPSNQWPLELDGACNTELVLVTTQAGCAVPLLVAISICAPWRRIITELKSLALAAARNRNAEKRHPATQVSHFTSRVNATVSLVIQCSLVAVR